MPPSLLSFLASQRTMKIVRGLMLSSRPLHLRELAARYSLSPAGTSDILRRLKNAGVLREVREGNRRCFQLSINEDEIDCLNGLFKISEVNFVRERAARYSSEAAGKLDWMEEAYSFYKETKKK